MASWLVVGCGYTGAALARRLVASGEAVVVTRRTAAAAAASAAELGAPAIALDLATSSPALADQPSGAAGGQGGPFDYVVCLAPPGAAPAAEMARLFAIPCRKLVYVSSTGVYAPGHGAWVDEAWPIGPITKSGRARAAAEAALAGCPVSWLSLRAAGIYGPGRGLAERIRAGSYRIVGDGTSHVSRIHVDDLITAIILAATTAVTGPVNAADDDPAAIGIVADTLAAALGRPPPPRVPIATVDPEVAGMLTADRKIVNRRLREELGVVLRHPSWRTALD